jgi:hypothetical protein
MMTLVMTLTNLSGGSRFYWTGFLIFMLCIQEIPCSLENEELVPNGIVGDSLKPYQFRHLCTLENDYGKYESKESVTKMEVIDPSYFFNI